MLDNIYNFTIFFLLLFFLSFTTTNTTKNTWARENEKSTCVILRETTLPSSSVFVAGWRDNCICLPCFLIFFSTREKHRPERAAHEIESTKKIIWITFFAERHMSFTWPLANWWERINNERKRENHHRGGWILVIWHWRMFFLWVEFTLR